MQLKTGKGLNAQQRGMAGINYNSLMADFNHALLKKKKKRKNEVKMQDIQLYTQTLPSFIFTGLWHCDLAIEEMGRKCSGISR